MQPSCACPARCQNKLGKRHATPLSDARTGPEVPHALQQARSPSRGKLACCPDPKLMPLSHLIPRLGSASAGPAPFLLPFSNCTHNAFWLALPCACLLLVH